MSGFVKNLATATLLASSVSSVSSQASGSGTTTRYWDCCKPSCAWSGKADVSAPVGTCDIDDQPLDDLKAESGCDGGPAYMCSDNSPWAVDDELAYGFAAVSVSGGDESSWCCSCFELTFTSGPVSGKKMVVQAVNTGADLGDNQFDIAIPGGGVGIFNGCTSQWDAPEGGWGEQYGGISDNTCPSFPEPLVDGCEWRFDWFQNADNPDVDFVQVQCPAELTAVTGCTRSDDGGANRTTTQNSKFLPRGFSKTPVRVPGAEDEAAPAVSPSSSSWPSWSSPTSWVTSPLVRRQWPTQSSSTPSSSAAWPTGEWPWPPQEYNNHVQRQWPPQSSSTPSSSAPWPTGEWPWPTEGFPWPPREQNNHVRRQWPSSSWPTPSWSWPTGGWPWPTGGWSQDEENQEHDHARRQEWPPFSWPSSFPTPSGTPTGGWPWPTEGFPWPPQDQNNHVRRQWPSFSWPTSSWPTPTGGWPWPTGGWPQDQDGEDQEHDHVRRQEWPPFSWPSSFPTPTGTPTGGWPWPTGEWPWPPFEGEEPEGEQE